MGATQRGYSIIDEKELDMLQDVEAMHLTGNILPPQWFKHLTFSNGKPHVNAAIILSDIVFWYRPIILRDETSQHIELRKRFIADKPQRSYDLYCDVYGLSKKQVREAMHFLADKGIITLEFRTIEVKGARLNNVLFVGLNLSKLAEISRIPVNAANKRLNLTTAIPPSVEGNSLLTSRVIPIAVEGNTYTESITEITDREKEEKAPSFF